MYEQANGKFHYIYSCELDEFISIKIGTLEGKRKEPSYRELIDNPLLKFSGLCHEGCSELFITSQIFANGNPLGFPVRTPYKYFTNRWSWNEWITLPVRYSDLPRNSILAMTIWDCHSPRKAVPVGGTTVSLFGKHGMYRSGMHDLKVWPDVEANGKELTTTPGKTEGSCDQMYRLLKLTKKYKNEHMVKVDWLDRLTFREIEVINEQEKRNSSHMYLMIEFPRVIHENYSFSIVYFEKDADDAVEFQTNSEMIMFYDPEIRMENLVENKHHKLVRSARSGVADKDLKPNAATRDQLNDIVNYPPTKILTSEEQDLIWKFRFYLTTQEKALAKFLKCVNWNTSSESKQALELLKMWHAMDVEDALELLSKHFTNQTVRMYAVTRLSQAPDEDLLLYLLQLVQALRYENYENIKTGLQTMSSQRRESVIPLPEQNTRKDSFLQSLADPSSENQPIANEVDLSPSSNSVELDLPTFLINRACANSTLANYFYWYLHVECEDQTTKDPRISDIYLTVMKRFSNALVKGCKEWKIRRSLLSRQNIFINNLVKVMKTIARESGNRKKKIEKLTALLAADMDSNKVNFVNFEPLPLPLDPDVKIKGVVLEKVNLFKSNLMPCLLPFKTTENVEYVAIFKNGDDLRQDQLIQQIITLMDKLLRRENLDLKLTPYKVLATSNTHGFVEFVESIPVAEVLSNEGGSIQNYFRKVAPSESSLYGISPEVMDTYVKSCAGYCVITYILGVGDRHLDNLLLTKTGKLFHIDFGYILGRDPKPLPPPMKLSKEMVEAMGGINSEYYQEFRKQCYTAFLHLRRHSNLILNLFSLMVDANIPDIALEPDKTVKKVQDKFRLDLTDEGAVHYMQNLIDVSVSAVMPALVEQIHKIAQVLVSMIFEFYLDYIQFYILARIKFFYFYMMRKQYLIFIMLIISIHSELSG
ncbi:Phosphatidylinositol 3-kinase catalytic subunit type 3 [Nymphon striatum]|nr:Phosphatidylinositol 3-kinase catalytic subunit type 3 [Nymphon striatum]